MKIAVFLPTLNLNLSLGFKWVALGKYANLSLMLGNQTKINSPKWVYFFVTAYYSS